MHELALIESVVDEVVARIGDQRVAIVRLEIGALAGVSVEALRTGFDVCIEGTPIAGASLDIVEVAAVARCRSCGSEAALAAYGAPCACGGFDRELIAGGELLLKEVEVY
ncbi:MAG: hydrogenase maturation nickel metallochaperone HypA [Deltaproteobacteria bacterium]|nr:hydrogenase maturation nickel metallochaperone HypA [Deltaproteobacteria bacterium]